MTPRNCFLRLTGPAASTAAAAELLDILAVPERPRTIPENQELVEDEVDEREGVVVVVADAERSMSERCYSTSFISTTSSGFLWGERERVVR